MAEDEANVAIDCRQEIVQAQVRVSLVVLAEAGPDHRVLAHEDRGLAAQGPTNLLHLLRPDEINTDDERLRASIKQVHELREVCRLLGFDPHCTRGGKAVYELP